MKPRHHVTRLCETPEPDSHSKSMITEDLFSFSQIGVNVGASALEVISLLPRFRPYQNSDELGWKEWEDQVCHSVSTRKGYVCRYRAFHSCFDAEIKYAMLRLRSRLRSYERRAPFPFSRP
jgi:hypothetical protein